MRFAKDIQQQGRIKSTGLIEGLDGPPRELRGTGALEDHATYRTGERLSADAHSDPRHLYENVLVALDERRKLNNGEPLGLLLFLDSLMLSAGDRFLHIGSGVGYYTAIAAHAVGPRGSVVAIEIDPALAARSAAESAVVWNGQARCRQRRADRFGTFDAIFVNAGCTRPHSIWLDQLAIGGRLLIPLTVGLSTMPGIGAGSMLLVTRGETELRAKLTSSVGIFHCDGARSAEEEALLAKAFAGGNRRSVCRLRRDGHGLGPTCWLHTSDYCLESDPSLRREFVHIEFDVLTNYVGHYQLAPNYVLSVTQRDVGLFAQLPMAPELPIYPESEKKFYCEAADAQITFETDGTGRATGLMFQHDGRDLRAQRVD